MFAGVTTALVLASRVPFLQGLYADSAQPWGILAAAGIVGLVQVPRAKHHLTDVVAGAMVGLVAEAAVDAVFTAVRARPRLRVALHKRDAD